MLVVFELIAVENHNGRSKIYSKGWTFLSPFDSEDVQDVNKKESPTNQYVMKFIFIYIILTFIYIYIYYYYYMFTTLV